MMIWKYESFILMYANLNASLSIIKREFISILLSSILLDILLIFLSLCTQAIINKVWAPELDQNIFLKVY